MFLNIDAKLKSQFLSIKMKFLTDLAKKVETNEKIKICQPRKLKSSHLLTRPYLIHNVE